MKISKARSRRGITLIETVVALAIVSVITAATLTLLTSQAKIRRKTAETIEAASIAENALECYAHAGEDGFFGLFEEIYALDKRVFGEELKLDGGDTTVIFNLGEDFEVTVRHGATEITRSISK